VSKTRAPTFEVAAVLNLTVLWSAFTLRQFVKTLQYRQGVHLPVNAAQRGIHSQMLNSCTRSNLFFILGCRLSRSPRWRGAGPHITC